MAEPTPLLHALDRAAFRAWLEEHHDRERVVWLVFHKKASGKQRLAYDDAVEEALCFGWIDSIVRRLDDERYAQKFTPRTDSAKWSPSNLARLRKILADGIMRPAGLARVAPAVLARLDDPPLPPPPEPELSPELAARLKKHPAARRTFEALPPSHRREYVRWIMSAKREETRARRLDEAIGRLSRGEKLGMK